MIITQPGQSLGEFSYRATHCVVMGWLRLSYLAGASTEVINIMIVGT